MINGTAPVGRGSVLTDVLDTPIAKLSVGHDVDVTQDLFDAGTLTLASILVHRRWAAEWTNLIILQAVLKDILDHQTSSFSKSNLVPHTAERLVDEFHDLGRTLGPSQLKELLPDMASISVDDRLGDATEELVDHDGLVVLWDRVESFLDNVASKGVHGQAQGIATDGFSDLDDLLRGTVLEAALDEEVAEPVDHERIGLGNNGLDNLVLLLGCADLELLLQEDRCLLIIVADDLVDNVLPVAIDVAVQQAAVVERLGSRQVCLALGGNRLDGSNTSQQQHQHHGNWTDGDVPRVSRKIQPQT